MDNFIELRTVEEANKIDLNRYTFLERLSAKKGLYIFKVMKKKMKDDTKIDTIW